MPRWASKRVSCFLVMLHRTKSGSRYSKPGCAADTRFIDVQVDLIVRDRSLMRTTGSAAADSVPVATDG